MHVVIVGAGVSALLLAQSLLRHDACEHVRIVGPRRRLRPRLLSYWTDRPTPFDAFAVASWSTLAVATEATRTVVPLTRFAYRTIRARPWAEAVRAQLASDPRVTLVDATVDDVEDHASHATVWIGDDSLEADWVFTSRPCPSGAPLWQRFEGWELELPDARVDVEVATLMDFRTPSDGDLRFVYALPLADDRLWVEHVGYRACDHASALTAYLHEVVGVRSWRVLERESGATPLFSDPPERGDGRVVRIGVWAGLAKTSTGYALTRMWRDAESIARSLARHGTWRAPVAWPSFQRLADRFFVESLRDEPRRLVDRLAALFANAPGDAVLAFLDDQAGLREQLAVARAMPGAVQWWLGLGAET